MDLSVKALGMWSGFIWLRTDHQLATAGSVMNEGKRPLGRPRRRWEDNIKMDL
jgi:hypothetical protein